MKERVSNWGLDDLQRTIAEDNGGWINPQLVDALISEVRAHRSRNKELISVMFGDWPVALGQLIS